MLTHLLKETGVKTMSHDEITSHLSQLVYATRPPYSSCRLFPLLPDTVLLAAVQQQHAYAPPYTAFCNHGLFPHYYCPHSITNRYRHDTVETRKSTKN